MSKTVKRVIRVMMIGLVAMLGAKAEAHYFIVGGKVKYCDICRALDLEEVPNPLPNTTVVNSVATTISGEVLCLSGKMDSSLVKEASASGIFKKLNKKGKAKVEVTFPVALLVSGNVCSTPGDSPAVVIIRSIVSVVDYSDGLGLASTYTAKNCQLPAAFNIDNPPPIGTPYVCGTQTLVHNDTL